MPLRATRAFGLLRTYSTLPQTLSEVAKVRLPRSLIAVHGKDSAKFLNGLITIRPPELTGLEPRSTGVGAYCAMLNAKGRVLADMFVYPAHDNAEVLNSLESSAKPNNVYLVDVDSSILDNVLTTLDFHVLTSLVEVQKLPNLSVFHLWDDAGEIDTEQFKDLPAWTEDKRGMGLGIRCVVGESNSLPGLPKRGVDEYRLRRYLFGVPEGAAEMPPNKALPLDYCIDYMGGIDFHKGCYLGQELTIRTHHHGNVRKRAMPIVLTKTKDEELSEEVYVPINFGVEPGTNITDDSPIPNADAVAPIFGASPFATTSSSPKLRSSGTVISALGNIGLAKVRVDTAGHEFRIGDLHVRTLIPFWWPN